jgi:hypothetical protein
MLQRLFTRAVLPVLLAACAAAPAIARGPRRHSFDPPRAAVAPNGVLLSPGDRWREVADAPPSPTLGPTVPFAVLGGTFPSIAASTGTGSGNVPFVADTGKLEVSPPVIAHGTTGGLIPSAQPGWHSGNSRS